MFGTTTIKLLLLEKNRCVSISKWLAFISFALTSMVREKHYLGGVNFKRTERVHSYENVPDVSLYGHRKILWGKKTI